jgi:hypothetical protein
LRQTRRQKYLVPGYENTPGVICLALSDFLAAQSVAAGGLMERTVTFGAFMTMWRSRSCGERHPAVAAV